MFRLLLAASVAVLTSSCLLSLAVGVPMGTANGTGTAPSVTRTGDDPVIASPAGVKQPTVQPTVQPQQPLLDTRASLQGGWSGVLQNGVPVQLTFLRDSTLILAAGGEQLNGTYAVSGNTVTLQFPDEPPATHNVVFNADRSELQLGTQRYTRVR